MIINVSTAMSFADPNIHICIAGGGGGEVRRGAE